MDENGIDWSSVFTTWDPATRPCKYCNVPPDEHPTDGHPYTPREPQVSETDARRLPNSATPPTLAGYPEDAWALAAAVSYAMDDWATQRRPDYEHNAVARWLWDAGWRPTR